MRIAMDCIKKRKRAVMIGLVIALVAVIIVIAVAKLYVKKDAPSLGTEGVGAPTDLLIETPYCTLRYPGNWNEYLVIKKDTNLVGFYAKIDQSQEQHLFDIAFGSLDAEYLGKIKAEGGSDVEVYIRTTIIKADEAWGQDVVDRLFAMQEDVNYVLSYIPFQEDGLIEEDQTEPAEIENTDLEIEFPYGRLYFPGVWNDRIRVACEQKEAVTVTLYATIGEHEEVELFRVIFGKEADDPIGFFKTVDGTYIGVHMVRGAFEPDESWTQDDKQLLQIMQESADYLLNKMELSDTLPEENEDAPASNTQPENDDIEIETPYAILKYPGQWKKQLRVKHTAGDIYTVAFYGEVIPDKEMLLFSIRFNDVESENIGAIKTPDGTEVPVGMVCEELQFEAGIDGEAMDAYYAMQEALNDVLDQLPLE